MATNEREAPIHGDILEAILSHVPLIHLVPARHVSKSWKRALSSSLRHVSPVKPWLTVHTQSPRAPHVTTSHAYDPRSRSWIQIHAPPSSQSSSPLRSSHSTLIYTLSPTGFSFSLDPLGLEWHHAPPPRVWRVDPVVACVGGCIIVAGGACDFEDDPLAVEMYDAGSRTWSRCESMPEILKGSTASTWLSVAVAGDRVHVTEKNSGVTYSFDSETKSWLGPYELRPEEGVFYCVTGTVRGRLVVAGMVGEAENVKGVKLWEVKGELGIGSKYWCEELGAMPKAMVAKMKGDDGCGVMASISVTTVGDYVYLVNLWEPEEMVVCEFADRGGCAWRSVRNEAVARMERMVFCGGYVGVEDLECAVAQKNCKFALQ
ncbi:F-box/kelch-repeat protein At1g23390-like [Lotus japonicus]|uniref:F-box/kelch-repeat protein At1g23390-like n=1 Tax=Lotus japonicus TaxID=34305 RepID=UPI002585544D|nr:F-box/kelch-repeat protein At1g23390-like [Lotus japonicus]